MSLGDGIIYYSPKMEFDLDHPCQQFTAIGFVEGDEVFPYDMGNGFIPYRRKIRYIESTPVAIKPLISSLEFITDKTKWGYHFRFGAFEIMEKDFCFIAGQMNVNW